MAFTPEERRKRKIAASQKWYRANRERILAKAAASYTRKLGDRPSDGWRSKREVRVGRPCPAHCEICGAGDKQMVYDHCHQSGVFRGWICQPCNLALGFVRDSPDHLRKLIAYLETNL